MSGSDMSGSTVIVEINQQQAELLDRLVAEGVGATHAEVIRNGFLGFCREHPALLEPAESSE
jgi:hypothetical protein